MMVQEVVLVCDDCGNEQRLRVQTPSFGLVEEFFTAAMDEGRRCGWRFEKQQDDGTWRMLCPLGAK